MATLTVNVLWDGEPVSDKGVFIDINTGLMPNTHSEEYTDENGDAVFDVPDYCEVDVYTGGSLYLSGVGVGSGHTEVTVSI